jgi:hypothetical protein
MTARNVMLFLVVIGFFAVIGGLFVLDVKPANKEFLQMLLIPLATAFTTLLGVKPQVAAPPKDGP